MRRTIVALMTLATGVGGDLGLASGESNPAVELYSALADERAARSLPPLDVSAALEAAAVARARALARAVERGADGRGDLPRLPTHLDVSLVEAGYRHERVEAAHVLAGETLRSTLFELLGAPSSFRSAFFAAELPDLGVGAARAGDRPVYVVLLALSMEESFVRRTADLRDLEEVRAHLLDAVNAERTGRGLHLLEPDPCLEEVAQSYAERMLEEEFFDHVSPDGEGLMDRLTAARCRMRQASENLAGGPVSVEEVIEGWLASSTHREALLGRLYRRVGYGLAIGPSGDAYGVIWVQVLGRR